MKLNQVAANRIVPDFFETFLHWIENELDRYNIFNDIIPEEMIETVINDFKQYIAGFTTAKVIV